MTKALRKMNQAELEELLKRDLSSPAKVLGRVQLSTSITALKGKEEHPDLSSITSPSMVPFNACGILFLIVNH